MSLSIIVGTRPEIVKMAPIIFELRRRKSEFELIHTGQHHDYLMARRFIEQLGLPSPNASFELQAENPAAQIGEMMVKLETVLSGAKARLLLIQGDTNTMLAAALVGLKLGRKIAHVEAGLRSFDWRMPEEHNRRMVDHVSDYLFAPTELSKSNLMKEFVHGAIFVTGNTIIDSVRLFLPMAEKESQVITNVRFEKFALATLHRAENVDDPTVLKECIRAFEKSSLPVVFPAHPRTLKRLNDFGIREETETCENIQVLPPQGYFDFLTLMRNCQLILTDSGGIQEEATSPEILKPVIVLRRSTERPEAVENGFAKLVSLNASIITREINRTLSDPPSLTNPSPFGDGRASERIVSNLYFD